MLNETARKAQAGAMALALALPLTALALDGATRSTPSATAPSSGGARSSGGTDNGFGDRKDNRADSRSGNRDNTSEAGADGNRLGKPGGESVDRRTSNPGEKTTDLRASRRDNQPGGEKCPAFAGTQPAATGRDATAASAGTTAPPQRLSEADETTMRALAQVHLFEAKLSGMANAISQNPRVHGYASKMLEDHLTALDSLRGVADRAGVILPGGVESSQAEVLHALAMKSGADFDAAYWNAAGVPLQQQELAYAEKVSGSAASPVLKCYAIDQGKQAGRHLFLAQQMTGSPQQAAAALAATRMAGQSVSPTAPAETPSNRSADNGSTAGASSLAGSAVHPGQSK